MSSIFKLTFEKRNLTDFVFPEPEMIDESESQEHRDKKLMVGLSYYLDGCDVGIEVGYNDYIIDVVADRDGKLTAVEVGETTQRKAEFLHSEFDEFRHIAFERDGSLVDGFRNPDRTPTVRVDDDAHQKLNELVEYYDEELPGKFSQRLVVNILIDDHHGEIFGNGDDDEDDDEE